MKSKKAIVAVAALVLPLQAAFAQDASFNAQLAISDVDFPGFDNGLAAVLGYETEVAPNVSIEGEFSMSIADPEYRTSFVNYELSYFTLGGYGKYTLPVDQKLSVFGRVGFVYQDIDIDNGVFVGWDGSDFGLALGFGGDLQMTPKMDLTVGYTIMDDINHLSAGIKYKL